MKKLIKLSLMLAAVAMTFSSCNCYKKMAKKGDQLSVVCSPEVATLNNGKVTAEISVNFPAKFFNKKAIVKATPVMVFKSGEVTAEPILLQGSKIKENYKVVDFVSGATVKEVAVFDYTPEMRRAELQVRVEVLCKCDDCGVFVLVDPATGKCITNSQIETLSANPTSAEAQQILRSCGITIADGVNTLQADIKYSDLMKNMKDNYKRVTTTVEKADLAYSINSSVVNSKALKSSSVADFKSLVASNIENDRATQTLYANGYASPDGPEKFNDKLSVARSESGRKTMEKLLKEYGLDIDAAAYGEDWDGFKELVANSNIEDKNLILQVLSLYDSSTQREEEIKNLSTVFTELKKDILPQLRRTQMTNKVDLQGKTDDEMLALVKSKSYSDLTLEEILHICNNLKVSQKDKIALLGYAAKEYDCARAYNNLGVAYAKVNNLKGAARAFKSAINKGAKGQEINDNMVLLNLANGDVEEAKKYAAGADGAVKSLIAAAEGDYMPATKSLKGYNAAIAYTQLGNYAAAKSALSGVKSNDAEYLGVVIASLEGDIKSASSKLTALVQKDKKYAEKASTDVNLKNLFATGYEFNL